MMIMLINEMNKKNIKTVLNVSSCFSLQIRRTHRIPSLFSATYFAYFMLNAHNL